MSERREPGIPASSERGPSGPAAKPPRAGNMSERREPGIPAELTLLAVHAHPDDESNSTGGTLARYSAEGVRTVLVTCTNGEFGDAPGKIKPDQDGHEPDPMVEEGALATPQNW